MEDFTTTILSTSAVSIALTASLIFLTKSWISERIKWAIQHEYDQKLEAHKSRLKAESDVEVERLKSQLQIMATERSIKLSKVFEDQAETIAGTYAKLVVLMDAFSLYTALFEFTTTPPKSERRKAVGEKLQELQTFYRPRKIYLPKETRNKIDAFIQEIYDQSLKFKFDVEDGLQKHTGNPKDDTWLQSVDFINKDCVLIMDSLDEDLKKILGLWEVDKK